MKRKETMEIWKNNLGLFTDHYELTMAQGYLLSKTHSQKASFDYFFRENPYKGGYVVFAGLADLLEAIENFQFSKENCDFLESKGFSKEFTRYLREFKFNGNISSVQEGEIIFPNEPVMRVEGNIIECQLIESILLNTINFQSLIATKASRMRQVANNKLLFDFGLRRAQGLGTIHASRASIIGGFNSTSNLYSAFHYHINSNGTMSHAWVQAFENELSAFRTFAKHNPENTILLVDTYDTLNSGIPNAITIAKEMEKSNKKLNGIRLDSGDLVRLSKKTRKMLNDANLSYVKIMASNQLDEFSIEQLQKQNAPIDAFGVGTALITGKGEGALDGVYKLSQINNSPTLKISDSDSKMTFPGLKTIYRYINPDGQSFYGDAIELEKEKVTQFISQTNEPESNYNYNIKSLAYEEIVKPVMRNGKTVSIEKSVKKIAQFARERLAKFPDEIKQLHNPDKYNVTIGEKLKSLQNDIKYELWKH